MVYTDAPASPSAAVAMVNELNLSMKGPTGKTFFPNHLAGPDNRNNSQSIDMHVSTPGTYKVIIRGANVPNGRNGKQPYALVVTAL